MESLLWSYFKGTGQVSAYLLYKALLGEEDGLDMEPIIEDEDRDVPETRKLS
ncbi:MAG TPA: YqzL family protein [Bacillota bacterium]|nr:YqzL family protein [Bacillota bacterium]